MERINFKLWENKAPPKKILAIRLQALGDTVITLPYLQSLARKYPEIQIDFLTRKEVADIPKNIKLFNKVYTIGGVRNDKLILLLALIKLPILWFQGYDMVIDLQRNRVSSLLRKMLRPVSWSEFDRFSPISAGERTRLTIEAVGLGSIHLSTVFSFKNIDINKLSLLGIIEGDELVILNPAGFFKTRNWPLENYIAFAHLWLTGRNQKTRFVLLGDNRIKEKAEFIERSLKGKVINLVNRTNVIEAFAIIQKASFILSEDSGLMHMGWVSGIPTLALFGSSRSDWSAPQGDQSLCLNSSDLPCGQCMAPNCKYGDIHCLTRFDPEMVFEKAMHLLKSISKV